jgi:AcrR family transcriptional regulator
MNPKPSKDDSRALILEAAFEAFAENGYDGTTMDEIVKRSGLSKGTLYWHFKNKHDLFVATLNAAMGGLDDATAAALQDTERPILDRLRELFLLAAQSFTADLRWTRLLANAFFQSDQSEEARQVLLEMYDKYLEMLEAALQMGIDQGEFRPMDTRRMAIVLLAGGDGIVFHRLLNPPWEIGPVMEAFVNAVLGGFVKEQTDHDSHRESGADV